MITENASASFGSYCVSAQAYCRAKDVWIIPIVVPKFKLCDVQRKIFAADLVELPIMLRFSSDQKPIV